MRGGWSLANDIPFVSIATTSLEACNGALVRRPRVDDEAAKATPPKTVDVPLGCFSAEMALTARLEKSATAGFVGLLNRAVGSMSTGNVKR